MPVQYILANLLANTEDALGAILLDDTGETVDLAGAEVAPLDLRIVGAYLGIYLRQMSAILADSSLGRPRLVHIEREAMHVHLTTLPDGYYLALLQRSPSLVGSARAGLARAAAELRREIFED